MDRSVGQLLDLEIGVVGAEVDSPEMGIERLAEGLERLIGRGAGHVVDAGRQPGPEGQGQHHQQVDIGGPLAWADQCRERDRHEQPREGREVDHEAQGGGDTGGVEGFGVLGPVLGAIDEAIIGRGADRGATENVADESGSRREIDAL